MSRKRAPESSVILVVEDDDLVRMNAVEALTDRGFAVVEARDADEAWDILGSRDDIGMVFTDIDMPGSMCGITPAQRVHGARPDFRLVLTSGRHRLSAREVPDNGLFVPKPYRASEVVDAIHHAT